MKPRLIDSNDLINQKMQEHEQSKVHEKYVKERTHMAYSPNNEMEEEEGGFVEGLFAERIDTFSDGEGNLMYGEESDPAEALTRELLAECQRETTNVFTDNEIRKSTFGSGVQSEREQLELEKADFAEQQVAYQEALEQLEERYHQIIQQEKESQLKAEEIIKAASDEAERIKQQAQEEGRFIGIQQGKEEGLRQAEEEIAEKETALEQEREQLETHYENLISQIEPKFMEVMTGIYRQVFEVDFSQKKEVIHYLIAKTLRRADGGKNYMIHVSKDEYPYVSQQKRKLQEIVADDATVDVVEDLTLKSNECLIETEGGVFDCGLGTELTELEKELKLLSFQPVRMK